MAHGCHGLLPGGPLSALQGHEGELWARPRASRPCPTEPCRCFPRAKSDVCPNLTQEHGRGRALHPAAPLPSTHAHISLFGHLRIKAGAHSRFSHQAFIIKKVPELPSHPLQPSPAGSEPVPALAGSAAQGAGSATEGGF